MDAPKRSSAVVWAVAVVVLSPVLYLASLGPVGWFAPRSPDAAWAIRWLPYTRQANWLIKQVPHLEDPIERYIDWWAN